MKNIYSGNKLLLLFILAFFILSLTLSYIGPISGDGCWHVAAGKFIAENNKIPFDEPLGRDTYFWSPFLYHLTIALFYKISTLIGINIIFLLLPLTYLGALIVTYLIAKEDFNKKVAVFSVLFLGTTPLFLDSSSNYFVEGFLTFFVLMAVYYARKENFLLSGLFFGFSIFSKLNGFCVLPLLLYIIYTKKRLQIRGYLEFLSLSILGLIPYIRNYILLGNPIWPFLNSIFNGVSGPWADHGLNFSIQFTEIIKSLVLNFLGVPHGAIQYSLERIQLIVGMDVAWIIYLIFFLEIVAVFIILIMGLKYKIKNKIAYIIWVLGFVPLQLIYLFNIGNVDLRFFLPSYPVIAIIFGLGVHNLIVRYKRYSRIILLVVLLLVITFIITVSAKHIVANIGWDNFRQDHEFIKENVPKNSMVYIAGQCMTAQTDRFSIPLPKDYTQVKNGTFIFLNEDYYVEPESSIGEEEQERIINATGCNIIYNNHYTKTRICKVG